MGRPGCVTTVTSTPPVASIFPQISMIPKLPPNENALEEVVNTPTAVLLMHWTADEPEVIFAVTEDMENQSVASQVVKVFRFLGVEFGINSDTPEKRSVTEIDPE